jgi:multidrug resistance efflux pump
MDINVQPETTPAAPPSPGTKRRRPGRRKKIVKNIIAIIISLGVVGALVWVTYVAFYMPDPEFYLTQRIEIWDVPIKRTLNGYGPMSPVLSETVTLTESGTVLEANAFYGATVSKGDVLVALDTSSIDEAVAEHEKEIARINKSIEDRNTQIANTEDAIAKLYADLSEANAEQIALAQAARLYAPFDGQIVDVQRLIIGQDIQHGMELGRIIDDSRMKLTLYFSYGYENNIYLGQPCEVSVPSVMSTVSGTVSDIEKVRRVGSDGSVSFEVTITMDNPGALVSQADATASMTAADGEAILPVGPGKLECIQEQLLVIESNGPLKTNNLRNFYDVKKGELLVELDFLPDTTIEDVFLDQVDAQQAIIDSHREAIEGYNEEIRGVENEITLEYERIDDLVIRAPIDGQVSNYLEIYPGMTLSGSAANPVSITVSQTDTLILEGSLYQSDVQRVEVGMPVAILYNSMPVTGILTGIDQAANEQQQMNPGMGASFPVTISLDNSAGTLMVGSYADFEIVLETSIDTPIVVPIQAIKAIGQDEYIFLKPHDGVRPETAIDWPREGDVPPGFYAIPVECGIQDRNYIEVTEGIPVEWEGWEVFTQRSDSLPSPLPSYDFEVEISDPEMRQYFDEGYAKGVEDTLNASPSPGEGDGYFDEFGNWISLPPGGDGGAFIEPPMGDFVIPEEGIDVIGGEEPADEALEDEAIEGEEPDGEGEDGEGESPDAAEDEEAPDEESADSAAPEGSISVTVEPLPAPKPRR